MTVRTSVSVLGAAFAGLALSHSLPVAAQVPAEWTSVAKITNGRCGDGAIAHITERPAIMHLRLTYSDGKQYAEFDMPLAADGSGKTQYITYSNVAVNLEVAAGTGKRPMKTSQATGICQYLWTPR